VSEMRPVIPETKGTTFLRNATFNVVLTLLSLVIGVCLCEAVLRIKNRSMTNYDIEMWRYAKELKFRSPDPALDHEHVHNASAILQSVEIRTNEWGLRGGAVPPPHPGQRRILFLGSSITLGWGVGEAHTVTERLQSMFSADHRDALVLNAGIGNYNAYRYVELFFRRLEPLKPTDIVVHYFLRDAEVLPPGGGNWILEHSELAVTLWEIWNNLALPSGDASITDHYRAIYAPGYSGLATTRSELQKLADYAKNNGVRIYLAIIPDVHNLTAYQLGFAHDIVRNIAVDLGYTYVDLLPAFGKLRAAEIWAMPGDPHPNALGHKIMAEALYPMLRIN
jgi:lysophospholipase L1-like esterase